VVDFSLDPLSGSDTAFRRDPQTHRQTLDEFLQRTGRDFERFNYLGEWHSHPFFSVHPSNDDIRTMTEMVEDQSSTITFAVLLIVRLRWRLCFDYSLTVFARGQALQPRQISGSNDSMKTARCPWCPDKYLVQHKDSMGMHRKEEFDAPNR
jgi:[CysO sulfur-carrier protein]-S-L-cysteine hydrolase